MSSQVVNKVAVVVGVGPGLGASAARRFASAGYSVGLVSRDVNKLLPVQQAIQEKGGKAFCAPADAGDEASLRGAFALIKKNLGEDIEVLVYNASGFARGSALTLKPEELLNAFRVTSVGLLIASQESLPSMIKNNKGSILVTGATGSLRGGANFGGFAAPKFSLRALAQSLARELHPQSVHVAHFIIDGQINTPKQVAAQPDRPVDSFLSSDAIAETYYQVHIQPKSTWAHEIDLRPSVEKF